MSLARLCGYLSSNQTTYAICRLLAVAAPPALTPSPHLPPLKITCSCATRPQLKTAMASLGPAQNNTSHPNLHLLTQQHHHP